MGRLRQAEGFLSRLRKDDRGNTLAIMCAAMIPMCAFAGSAIDMGRLYVVKTRLQTACDSGVLAGRKFMDPATGPGVALTGTALTQANSYFNNNFVASWGASGWYKSGTQTFTPTTFADSTGVTQVQGTASAQVPMTLMAMFGSPMRTLSVTCQASFDTPDTDVMFVIDTTGSMSCVPSADPSSSCGTTTAYTLPDGSTDYYNSEVSGSKLSAVRSAIDTFYTTLAASIKGTGANVRYGFVPYNSTVNVGQALYTLNPAYLATSWTYQSRVPSITTTSSAPTTNTVTSQSACTSQAQAQSAYNSSDQSTSKTATYSTSTSTGRNPTTTQSCTVVTTTYQGKFTYQPVTYSPAILSPFIQTLANGGTVDDPTKVTTATTSWQGCVEEQTTGNYNSVSSYNIDSLPADMNPDLIPTASTTPWGPMWQAVEYARNGLTSQNGDYGFYNSNTDTETGETNVTPDTTSSYPKNPNYIGTYERYSGWVPCGQAVQRLTANQTQAQIDAYTAALHPHGGTYHDTGMIWGLRMISPQGIFGSDTAAWTGHPDPKRVIVFLTDGAMSTSEFSYTMTGIESLDKRVRGSNTDDLDNYHNARFLAECEKAQEKNIQVWVVAVGQSLTTQLQACVGTAHPERAIFVNSSTDLSTAFKNIATAVSQLRISQ